MIILTSTEVRDVMPTECSTLAEAGKLVMGAIQIPVPAADSWPSGYDLDREAKARFGAVIIADCEPYDDESTVTFIVIRA